MREVLGESPYQPTRRDVFIVTSPVHADSPIDVPPACVATRPSDRSAVNYAILDEPLRRGFDELAERFPGASELGHHGYACVDDAIADLGGYHRDDVSAFSSLRQLGLLKARGW